MSARADQLDRLPPELRRVENPEPLPPGHLHLKPRGVHKTASTPTPYICQLCSALWRTRVRRPEANWWLAKFSKSISLPFGRQAAPHAMNLSRYPRIRSRVGAAGVSSNGHGRAVCGSKLVYRNSSSARNPSSSASLPASLRAWPSAITGATAALIFCSGCALHG